MVGLFNVCSWMCFWLALTTVTAQKLDLNEGQTCNSTEGVVGTCKELKDCPTALEEIKKLDGKRPEICSFKGIDVVVCCKTEKKLQLLPGEKSREMCEKYAESVFLHIPDLSSGNLTSFDTCNVGKKDRPQSTEVIVEKDSNTREYPHMAVVGVGNASSIEWICGGSLISERFVLGVAHCKPGADRGPIRWVRLGDLDIESQEDDDANTAQTWEYEIDKIIVHPEYNETSHSNDIALYRTKEPIRFTEFVRPICLNTEKELKHNYALATGWGWSPNKVQESKNEPLKAINLTIIPHDSCQLFLGARVNGEKETTLCAGDLNKWGKPCKGVSGASLQVPLESPYCMYSQIAITSVTSASCEKSLATVFTRVSFYIPWIESIVWP